MECLNSEQVYPDLAFLPLPSSDHLPSAVTFQPSKEQKENMTSSTLLPTTITQAQKRWRTAYLAICSARAMLSLVREMASETNSHQYSGILHSVSYTVPDTERSGSKHRNKCHESTFNISDADQTKFTEMVKEKDLASLNNLGGVEGVANAFGINSKTGITGHDEEVRRRRQIFGPNTYHKPPPKGFLFFALEALRDTTILILLVCAALALGFGIKQHGLKEGWYEGGSIFVAVFLVIVVSAFSNFRQETQFDKLSKISDNIKTISIFDIVVGDIVFLNIGDQIPADGLFLDGHSLEVDESSMTGESDHVAVNTQDNPFLFSGSKIADGYAQMLVTSVGMSTAWGEMMSSITRDSNERTPLQTRLDKLTSSIGKVGLSVAFVVLLVMLIRYFTGNTTDDKGEREYIGSRTDTDDVINAVVRIVAAAVTIVVVAIPEGLPLAVTLTLAYSMKRMMADQAMVRKLSACETMGSATVICTDKTGTLTMNQMKVTKFWLGQEPVEEDSYKTIAPSILELFHQGVSLNTTGSVYKAASGSAPEFSGSPTEKAILSWAVSELGMDMEKLKESCAILHVETFNSEKKRSGVSIRKMADNSVHIHWKGAAEMILALCSSYYDSRGSIKSMDEASSLRCIAFAHKRITEEGMEDNDGEPHQRLQEDGLTLLGIVGLKDPCRIGAKKAVEACKAAGVSVKMITGDNIFTAKAIAVECGILELKSQVDKEEVVEGAVFRNYTDEQRMERVDKIRVMARQKGHVVAVTGDGTNDAPALKEADIGLSMGIQGTEVAKESSDIVILDDNFASVATVLRWGRCVYNNIQKFIQFQLTVNVAALVINFIAAVSAGEVPLTAVQLLWVNLIMDTLGALALATERPTDELMEMSPVGRTAPLITNIMWRNLLAQAFYQITILLILQFAGESIFNVSAEVNDTLIFNTFVLCQVFNEFNARNMESRTYSKGFTESFVVMVEFLKKFANTERLNWWQWVTCIAMAAVSWPIGWFVKLVPVSGKPFLSTSGSR
ncbi:calcium-transporting ATPase 12, plasma membrane-type [Salix suchowensis]|nr:calcium-transporting ATPase 12, plasma membrane-type [Salix suchowensis]